MNDLTTCPFCNQAPMGCTNDKDNIHPLHRVVCVCGAMGPIADTEEDAADQWNAWRAAQHMQTHGIQTAQDLLRALYGVLQASQTVELRNMPESTESHEAVSMADLLHTTLLSRQRQHSSPTETPVNEWAEET